MIPNLKTNIGKLELKNPVMVASGTFGYGQEFHENFYDISRLGAVVTKGISLKPMKGNPPPRIVETASGMLNAIGLQNVSCDAFLKEKLPYLKKTKATVIVNVLGNTIDEYAELAGMLEAADGVDGIELNISCPNVKNGGVQFGTDPGLAGEVTRAARKVYGKTLIVKLSPSYHDMALMAKTVEGEGADAVSLINSLTGMAIDLRTRRPRLANIIGGLTGPAIKPVALRMVWQAARAVKIPVIGIGGIMNAGDAIEFLIAGATAVQIGTANFIDPTSAMDVLKGIKKYLSEENISDVKELINSLILT